MRSEANTVEQYLAELPEERRSTVEAVRQVILDNLPSGYEELMNWEMITYQVPIDTYPDTYNGKPLMYAALASQKNYMSLYLTGVYLDETARKEFIEQYRATGKKLDMAKSCIRFKKLQDLPLPLIGKAIAAYDVAGFVSRVESVRKAAGPKITST